MSEAKMTGRKVNKPGCATVRNQATALFSLLMRLGQHVHVSNNTPYTFVIFQCKRFLKHGLTSSEVPESELLKF